MKKQVMIILGIIFLVGTVIGIIAGTILTTTTLHDRDITITLTAQQKAILNEKSSSPLILGNITCRDDDCYLFIYRDNKFFTGASFKITKNVTDYTENEFLGLRDIAVNKAIKDQLAVQKVNVGGDIIIR